MKSDEENLPPFEEDLLDLLVDGELNDTQRRELLKSLEHQPDGWRRCAMAFLEAQSWRGEMRQLLPSAAERSAPAEESRPATAPAAAPPARRAPRSSGRWATPMAMAAGFLVALVLGTQIRLGSHDSPGRNGTDQADRAQSARSNDPWHMVTLTGQDSSGNRQSVQLPAREEKSLDPSWWQPGSPAIPEDVRRALQASGHQIRQSRQFLPVPMQDGRRLVVPVDQVDVDYVGNPQYQ